MAEEVDAPGSSGVRPPVFEGCLFRLAMKLPKDQDFATNGSFYVHIPPGNAELDLPRYMCAAGACSQVLGFL